MLKALFSLFVIANNAHCMPTFYQEQAQRTGVEASKLYAVALSQAGVNTEFGEYLPWPWSVTAKGSYYQFKNRIALFEFLKANMGEKNISYGISGQKLMTQSTDSLWQSLDTVYQINNLAKKLKSINCDALADCVALYQQKNIEIININGVIAKPTVMKTEYDSIIATVSQEIGIEISLIHAVISQESAYKVNAKSHAGAVGLMQLMPDTARYLGLKKSDFYDPYKNINAGARYLKEQLVTFDGRLDLALAAYNAGPGAVRKYKGIPPFEETQAYVPKVIGYYRYFKKNRKS